MSHDRSTERPHVSPHLSNHISVSRDGPLCAIFPSLARLVPSRNNPSLKSSFSNKPQRVGNPAVHNAAIKNQVGRSPAAVAGCPPLHEQPIWNTQVQLALA
jgi:hypothetical protein